MLRRPPPAARRPRSPSPRAGEPRDATRQCRTARPRRASTSAARACSASRSVTVRASWIERWTSGCTHSNGSSVPRISTRRIARAASAESCSLCPATSAASRNRPLVPSADIAAANCGARGPSAPTRRITRSATEAAAASATAEIVGGVPALETVRSNSRTYNGFPALASWTARHNSSSASGIVLRTIAATPAGPSAASSIRRAFGSDSRLVKTAATRLGS